MLPLRCNRVSCRPQGLNFRSLYYKYSHVYQFHNRLGSVVPKKTPFNSIPFNSHSSSFFYLSCRPFHHSIFHFNDSQPHNESERIANMGECILTIQSELEDYCRFGLTKFSIYNKDVQFYDPHTKVHLTSKTQYKYASRLLKMMLNFHFISPQIVLTSLQQQSRPLSSLSTTVSSTSSPTPTDPTSSQLTVPKEYSLIVRFVFSGLPRLRWYWSRLVHPYGSVDDYVSEFECVCVYVFDSKGKVKSHLIERVRPQPTFWKVIHWAPILTKRFSAGARHPRPGLGLELVDHRESTKP